jgi:hypothetical protein
MLFGPCAQDATASFLPATSSLCAGGVGFVTAMMATLAASSRVAPAKTLGRAVPEVDRLAVHIVTDNVVIQFVPTETASCNWGPSTLADFRKFLDAIEDYRGQLYDLLIEFRVFLNIALNAITVSV